MVKKEFCSLYVILLISIFASIASAACTTPPARNCYGECANLPSYPTFQKEACIDACVANNQAEWAAYYECQSLEQEQQQQQTQQQTEQQQQEPINFDDVQKIGKYYKWMYIIDENACDIMCSGSVRVDSECYDECMDSAALYKEKVDLRECEYSVSQMETTGSTDLARHEDGYILVPPEIKMSTSRDLDEVVTKLDGCNSKLSSLLDRINSEKQKLAQQTDALRNSVQSVISNTGATEGEMRKAIADIDAAAKTYSSKGLSFADTGLSESKSALEKRLADLVESGAKMVSYGGGITEDVKGTVKIITPDGTEVPLASRRVLNPGDLIKTGKDSHVTINQPDGSNVEIGPNSRYVHGDLVTGSEDIGSILAGKIKVWIKKALTRRFLTRTPTAVAAVRGTEFTMSYDEKNKVTEINLFEGVLEVTNLATNETKKYGAGQIIRIEEGIVSRDILTEKKWESEIKDIEEPSSVNRSWIWILILSALAGAAFCIKKFVLDKRQKEHAKSHIKTKR